MGSEEESGKDWSELEEEAAKGELEKGILLVASLLDCKQLCAASSGLHTHSSLLVIVNAFCSREQRIKKGELHRKKPNLMCENELNGKFR